jgi:putative toxin-antitoxin system antitoxin component (TIGR02293 family)
MATSVQAVMIPELAFDLQIVESGLPVEMLSEFVAATGVQWKDIFETVIPARTLKHRRANLQLLSRDESDKFARLVRIFDQASTVLGGSSKALAWITKPKKRFGSRTPMQVLATDFGGRLVEEMLGQIDEGMFA